MKNEAQRKTDGRYSVAQEWCGYERRLFVARFMGEWVGSSETEEGATKLCLSHGQYPKKGAA